MYMTNKDPSFTFYTISLDKMKKMKYKIFFRPIYPYFFPACDTKQMFILFWPCFAGATKTLWANDLRLSVVIVGEQWETWINYFSNIDGILALVKSHDIDFSIHIRNINDISNPFVIKQEIPEGGMARLWNNNIDWRYLFVKQCTLISNKSNQHKVRVMGRWSLSLRMLFNIFMWVLKVQYNIWFSCKRIKFNPTFYLEIGKLYILKVKFTNCVILFLWHKWTFCVILTTLFHAPSHIAITDGYSSDMLSYSLSLHPNTSAVWAVCQVCNTSLLTHVEY